MINYKRIALIFLIVIVAACSLYFFLDKAYVNGILAGFLTGSANFFIIVLTVKSLLLKNNENSAGKAVAAVIIYFFKMLLLGGLVAALVILREKYNIFGFLIGFTACLAVIGIENFLTKKCVRRQK